MANCWLTPSDETLLFDRGFKFYRQLGEGAYAKVYLASMKNPANYSEKLLACKLLETKKAPKEYLTKFLPRELDILIKINHPNIIHMYSIFQRRTKFLVFMRYAEVGDLLDYILDKGELPEDQARLWFKQLAMAVLYLHTLNIAHRDIKCENILITSNFNIKLADFGFSRYCTDNKGKQVTSTTFCGSLAYVSPEILKGKAYYPKISDIWSMGVVLFVMLNKSMPFSDENARLMLKMQMNKKWKFRSKIKAIVSSEVQGLTTSLLEPEYKQRIQIEEIINHLWFSKDDRTMIMSPDERNALDCANRNFENQTSKNKMKKLDLTEVKSYHDAETFSVISTLVLTKEEVDFINKRMKIKQTEKDKSMYSDLTTSQVIRNKTNGTETSSIFPVDNKSIAFSDSPEVVIVVESVPPGVADELPAEDASTAVDETQEIIIPVAAKKSDFSLTAESLNSTIDRTESINLNNIE